MILGLGVRRCECCLQCWRALWPWTNLFIPMLLLSFFCSLRISLPFSLQSFPNYTSGPWLSECSCALRLGTAIVWVNHKEILHWVLHRTLLLSQGFTDNLNKIKHFKRLSVPAYCPTACFFCSILNKKKHKFWSLGCQKIMIYSISYLLIIGNIFFVPEISAVLSTSQCLIFFKVDYKPACCYISYSFW